MAHEPLRAPLRDYNAMSDDELDDFVASEESTDKFHVPQNLIPDGMAYQWVRMEVYGKPDPQNLARMEQKGWASVPAERHPGRWLPREAKGPIIVDGLMLMELPDRLYDAKLRQGFRAAKGQVRSLEEQMIYAPAGTGPRDAHPKTRPQVRKNYERPISVEA